VAQHQFSGASSFSTEYQDFIKHESGIGILARADYLADT
jgi:hypothetical protein